MHAALDEACIRFLRSLQDQLAESAQPIALCPAQSLHSTVAYFVSARSHYVLPKERIWAEHGPRWAQRLHQASAGLAPYEMVFDRVHVSARAVIAQARPAPTVDAVRALVSTCQLEAGLPGRQPDIVYVTVARYGEAPVDLAALRRVAGAIDARWTAKVSSLVLSAERVYPNLVSDHLAAVKLGGPGPPATALSGEAAPARGAGHNE